MTHIRQESALQPIHGFRFLFRLDKHGFRLLQFRNIIINADNLHLPMLRFKLGHYHIHPYPVPLVGSAGFQDTHFATEVLLFTRQYLLVKVKDLLPVFRMHLIINAHNG